MKLQIISDIHLEFGTREFDFSQAEQRRFETVLTDPEGANSISNSLFGQQSNGLFTQLNSTLTAAAAAFEKNTDATGLFLNVSI